MNKKRIYYFRFECKNNIFVKINSQNSTTMLDEKFFDIFKSYINDLVDVAVKNTLKEYGFDEKGNNQSNKKQKEQEEKYQEQERKYQEQQKQKQQETKQDAKQNSDQETKHDTKQNTKKTPFDEFQEQFNKYKKYSDKFEEDDKKTSDNYQKKTNDYQQKSQQKTTKNPTITQTEQQYYNYLGIAPTSTWEEIKAGYKTEMKRYHPDKYASEPEKQKNAEKISQKINEAYHYFEKKFKK